MIFKLSDDDLAYLSSKNVIFLEVSKYVYFVGDMYIILPLFYWPFDIGLLCYANLSFE